MKRILTLSALVTLTIASLVQAAPFAYVPYGQSGSAPQIAVIDLETQSVVGDPIPVGVQAMSAIALTPDGTQI